MADIVSRKKRSQMMSGIRGTNTRPEIMIRKALHAEGFRFRLHDKRLPGKPDLVLPKYRAVIMVHGCFWHGHDCHLFKWPKTRTDFWQQKIGSNRTRDALVRKELELLGWRVAEIWECALKGRTRSPFEELIDDVTSWLKSDNSYACFTGNNSERVGSGIGTH